MASLKPLSWGTGVVWRRGRGVMRGNTRAWGSILMSAGNISCRHPNDIKLKSSSNGSSFVFNQRFVFSFNHLLATSPDKPCILNAWAETVVPSTPPSARFRVPRSEPQSHSHI